jgi:pimeloyl-ACP methyl ester carboxylesterase
MLSYTRSVRGRWVERPWGRMRVWESGRGPTLLAVHGLGGSGRYWEGLAGRVGDRFRVVAPDLSGFGSSDKPELDYDRGAFLEDLDAAIDADGGIAVVGHSLGGVLAVLWAGRHPARVSGLALAAAPFPEPRPDWDPSRWTERRTALPSAVGTALRVAWPVVSLPILATRRYPSSVVKDYGRQTMRSRVWTLWSLWSEPGLLGEVEEAAERLQGHALGLWQAEDDKRVGIENLRRWSMLFPMGERVSLPDGGHQFLLRTRFAPLEPWLRALPPPSSSTAPTLGP